MDGSVETIRQFITDLGGTMQRVQVSRVDLAADFASPGGLSLAFLRTCRVCKSKQWNAIEKVDRLETAYFGSKGAPIQGRIYNKAIQALRKTETSWIVSV